MKESSVIVLVADGLTPDALARAMADGDVPELASLAAAGGLHTITTVFPSVTGVAYLPMLTGWHPGPAGVPGLRWYDRSRRVPALLGHSRSYVGPQVRRIDGDLAPEARTVFELAGARALGSMAMVTRGLPPRGRLDRGWRFNAAAARAHLAGDVAAWAALEEELAARFVERVRREQPRFAFAAFTAGDKATHAGGSGALLARRSLQLVDEVARRVRLDAEADGRWRTLHLRITSDHGHAPVTRHAELADLVRDLGFRVRAHPWTLPDRSEVAVMVSGNGMAHVYADLDTRVRRPWTELPRERTERLATIAGHPAVDLVAVLSAAGALEVRRQREEALVLAEGGRFSYRPVSGDPLGCGAFERLCPDAAHERCRDTPYPDGVVQLAQLAMAPRSGDLVVSAARGWDLRRRHEPVEHHSSHGALHREHMLVPLLGNRPAAGRPRRTADLFADVTRALGSADR